MDVDDVEDLDDGDEDDVEDEVEDDVEAAALDRGTVRVIALAMCDGPWEPTAMLGRIDATIEPRNARAFDPRATLDVRDEARTWLTTLVDDALQTFTSAPSTYVLERWISPRKSRVFRLVRYRVLRFPTPAPEMRESRWNVPALATTRELAMWLGVSIDALDAWTRHIADAPVTATSRGTANASDAPATATSPGTANASDAPATATSRGTANASDAHSAPGAVVDHRARHYRYAWIAKAHGHRLLEAPKPRLRAVQRDLLDGIIARIEAHDAAFGFRAGRSVVDFAAQHVNRDTVIRLDLKAFFTSVFAPRVAGILRTAGYPEQVARTIAAVCTHRTPADVLAGGSDLDATSLARLRTPHLPQGAPTSGALANLAAYRLDVRISALAERIGARYSRYADDLVLSGDRTLAKRAPSIIARIGAIAIEEGFALNYRKTRVMTAADQQRIAGIVINAKPAMQREELERLRAILVNCTRTGPAAQNRVGVPDFRAHLRGRIAWVAQLDPTKGERLRALFDQIRWDLAAPES